MSDEGTRFTKLFVVLATALTKIHSKNLTGAILMAVKTGDFF
jgi:hypothetical protein